MKPGSTPIWIFLLVVFSIHTSIAQQWFSDYAHYQAIISDTSRSVGTQWYTLNEGHKKKPEEELQEARFYNNGLLIRHTIQGAGNSFDLFQYTYNGRQLIFEKYYNTIYGCAGEANYVYTNGKLSEIDGFGYKSFFRVLIQYDTKGRIQLEEVYQEGKLYRRCIHTYASPARSITVNCTYVSYDTSRLSLQDSTVTDSAKRIAKRYAYLDGERYKQCTTEYDSAWRPLRSRWDWEVIEPAEQVRRIVTTYKYNERGMLIQVNELVLANVDGIYNTYMRELKDREYADIKPCEGRYRLPMPSRR